MGAPTSAGAARKSTATKSPGRSGAKGVVNLNVTHNGVAVPLLHIDPRAPGVRSDQPQEPPGHPAAPRAGSRAPRRRVRREPAGSGAAKHATPARSPDARQSLAREPRHVRRRPAGLERPGQSDGSAIRRSQPTVRRSTRRKGA
jgi:hypothetical protein